MEEETDGSSKRRRPHGSTKIDDRSVIPDWAALLPELIQGIAYCVLSTTGGVDAYMHMRGVCPSWRKAITMPSPLAAVADFRFRPRHWIMLDLKSKNPDDDTRLFLHATTGRFRRLRLPVLRDHTLIGATDGLLVLGDREPPHLAHVLNPFTGDMIHFAAPLPEDFKRTFWYVAVSGGSHSMLVLCEWGTLLCAAPTSDVFTENHFTEEDNGTSLMSLVNFRGNIYCTSPGGCVFEFVAPAELVVIAKVSPHVDVYTEGDNNGLRSYLVESGRDLLLICRVNQTLNVFRVNVEHKLLEKVKSISGRALFLGEERCVSIDADKLPSVEEDCIYFSDFEEEGDMWVYNLRGDTANIISSEDNIDRPFSLVQFLLRYCEFCSML